MAVKGEQARGLLRTLLNSVADLIPHHLTATVTGEGKTCLFTVTPSFHPDEFSSEPPKLLGASATLSLFGIGPWVPLLPRSLAAKLTVQDALETIQTGIADALGSPWPVAECNVKVKSEADGVRVWFQNPAGQVIEVATISYDQASP
jgi:hypothetical protein